jgi:dihydrofolate reductase
MSKVSVDMSMSLDGFVAGPNTDADHPLGEGGEHLHRWLFTSPQDPRDTAVAAELSASVGAVVLGRRTFEVGVPIWEDVPFPAPCYVLTHHARDELAMPSGSFTFITRGVHAAVAAAKIAAGDKNVQLMGAQTAAQVIAAGLLDELQITLVPILLGRGERMFGELPAEHVQLQAIRVIPSGSVTHLRYRVVAG